MMKVVLDSFMYRYGNDHQTYRTHIKVLCSIDRQLLAIKYASKNVQCNYYNILQMSHYNHHIYSM